LGRDNREAAVMPKRPPYIEIIVTVLVMGFLALIVVGAIDSGSDSRDLLTMRAD
jgi:hypothetical protein